MYEIPDRIIQLLDRGVVIPSPASVEIGSKVNPDLIAPGVTLHRGSRILGSRTSIGPGSEIGAETPAAIDNCQLGACVHLRGGYFSGSTFLDNVSIASGAHVRPGCLLEEQSNAAHTVGLKQTILFPFVTAGSLINFCDCFMAGGTSRRNHSEVGSSYVHFNFTPHQDKATPSLMGDVPRGVMLCEDPIFLGGQGGLVGPARIGYGSVIPAGTIYRGDAPEGGKLLMKGSLPSGARAYRMGLYGAIARIVTNNLIYIGNMRALRAWYEHARQPFMKGDKYSEACYTGALARLDLVLDERLRRLGELASKMKPSMALAEKTGTAMSEGVRSQQAALAEQWPGMRASLEKPSDELAVDADGQKCLDELHGSGRKSYLEAVASLSDDARRSGTAWLQAIVDDAVACWRETAKG